jgi:hypothetical protein
MTKDLLLDTTDLLNRVLEFLDNYVDVVDGDYGEPRPNRAMSLTTEVGNTLRLLEKEPIS